jgi:hypothetical protein
MLIDWGSDLELISLQLCLLLNKRVEFHDWFGIGIEPYSRVLIALYLCHPFGT